MVKLLSVSPSEVQKLFKMEGSDGLTSNQSFEPGDMVKVKMEIDDGLTSNPSSEPGEQMEFKVEVNDGMTSNQSSDQIENQFSKTVTCNQIKKLFPKTFACKKCGKSLASYKAYLSHHKTHKGEKVFNCEVCGLAFAIKSNLQRHLLRHKGEKKYTCELCGKLFITNSNLATHMRTHKIRKRHSCSHCGSAYLSKYSLKRHMQHHLGKYKFHYCNLCEKNFVTSTTLKKHMKTQHVDEETLRAEKPFVCSICGKMYSTPQDLQGHQRYHAAKKFHCNVCGKGFVNKSDLQKHVESHKKTIPVGIGEVNVQNFQVFVKEEVTEKSDDSLCNEEVEVKLGDSFGENVKKEDVSDVPEPTAVFVKDSEVVHVKIEADCSEPDGIAEEDCDPLA